MRRREDAPERLQGEGVRARIALGGAGQRGDRGNDAIGDVYEQLAQPRLGAREHAGRVGVTGLNRLDEVEGSHHRVRGHRGERRSGGGLGHGQLLTEVITVPVTASLITF
uniref:hypothetical protein n=1 Tax=Streptomyces sp. NBC_01562 TaxID=2975879 RepID=UPI002F90AD8C